MDTLLRTDPAAARRPARPALRALLVALLALALGGCAATSVEQQVPLASPSFRTIAAGEELGQTFVVHHSGLAGVEVFLQPEAAGGGALRAELRGAPGGAPLATASLPVAAVTEPRMYALPFAAPLESRQRDYYLALTVEGEGALQAAVMPGGAYRQGSLYVGGAPADGQLVHGQIFAAGPRALGLAGRLAGYLGLLLAGLAVLILPGLGLLAAMEPPGTRRTPAERAGLAAGIGAALIPALMVWAQLAGVALGPWNAWLPALLGAGLLGWRRLWPRRGRAGLTLSPPRVAPAGGLRQGLAAHAPEIALGAALLLIVTTRLAVVGSLEAPMWGDSVQHATMVQLILDNGGLFTSWAPYVPYVTLTNQFGFAAIAASLGWAAGLDGVGATILGGQLLNAAAALALYPLATRVAGGRPAAGLVAVIVAGLISPIPGFYVNWGRYAQLAGQVALPAAMLLAWELAAARRLHWPAAALVGLLVAGMCLSYYRMAFFFASFAGVLLICHGLPAWGRDWRAWRGGLGRLALAAAFTAAIFLPWAIQVRSSGLAETIRVAAAVGIPLSYVQADYAAWGLLPQYMPPWMLGVAAVALVWGALRRAWMLLGMFLWLVPPAGYMYTSLFGVPGAVMLQSFAVVIITYIPVAVAWGWLAAELGDLARRRGWPRAARALAPAALAALALWGALQQLRIVDPAFMLVTRPDTKAMAWIRAEAPPDARFLVHGFDVYAGTTVVGSDAGWWIPVLGRRANTLPPQYALANERPDPPDYTQRVVALVHTLKATPATTPAGMAALCAEGITHIYNGQDQGGVGVTARPLFTPAELDASPHFTRQYAADRVSIYSFDRQVCPPGAPAAGD